MRTSAKLALTALAASLLLAAMVSTATATRLSTSNQTIRATWDSLEFTFWITVRCKVTLEGSFHGRTIAKVARSLIGAITNAQVKAESCTNGTASAFNGVERYNGTTTPNTLPWHLTYESFTGTLPNINSIRVLLQRFRLGFEAVGCAIQVGASTDNLSADATLESSRIIELTPTLGRNRGTIIRTDRDPIGTCPLPGTRGSIEHSGRVMLLGNTTRISITLI